MCVEFYTETYYLFSSTNCCGNYIDKYLGINHVKSYYILAIQEFSYEMWTVTMMLRVACDVSRAQRHGIAAYGRALHDYAMSDVHVSWILTKMVIANSLG